MRLHKQIAEWGLTIPLCMSMLRQGLYHIPILHLDTWFSYILAKQPEVLTGGYLLGDADLSLHLKSILEDVC